MENENKKSKDEEFFDNCPICQMMKAAKEQGREPMWEGNGLRKNK